MKNNKGITIIEMLLVLALIAISITIASLSYTAISKANVQKAANAYAYAVQLASNTSMAKGPTKGALHITHYSDGSMKYYIGIDATNMKDICTSQVNVFKSDGASAPVALPVGSYEIEFNTAGMVTTTTYPKVLVFNRGQKSYKVTVNKLTGKADVETTTLP